jgi:hypothetical protein
MSALLVPPVEAQVRQEPSIRVDVTPLNVSVTNGSTSVVYSIASRTESTDSVEILVIDAPVTPRRIVAPSITNSRDYLTGYNYGSRSAVTVGFLGERLRPGDRRDGLTVEGAGLPGIVAYWVIRHTEPADVIYEPGDSDPPPPPDPDGPFSTDTVDGRTVGIVRVTDHSPAALTARLATLVGRACTLGWITGRATCDNIRASAAAGRLDELMTRLGTERGKRIKDSAYFLLRANAEYIVARQRVGRRQTIRSERLSYPAEEAR